MRVGDEGAAGGRRGMARDADRRAVALILDLGETGLVEELCQFADHVVIDGGRIRC